MFLNFKRSGYDRDGQQVASGRFLLLVQPTDDDNAPIRALVRFTSMRQLGQFMMGHCTVFGQRVSLSGSYGNDGLPCHVSRTAYDQAVEVPAELIAAWNTGGGHNGVGSEASAMLEWAAKVFPH
jgi:hypothetical protein